MVRFPDPRKGPPYHMHDMILSQPEFVKETLGRVRPSDASLLGDPRALMLTGCGTSFHAAMYGAAVLQEVYGSEIPVRSVHAYDILHGANIPKDATVLGVSHSGATSTTNRALRSAEKNGARTIGLCGLPDTPMHEVTDEVVVTGSAHDASWANTMSYTTQLAAFARIASGIGRRRDPGLIEDIEDLPAILRRALRCEGAIRRIARSLPRRPRLTYLGSGYDSITVLEGALKIRETCSVDAVGYHPEQFLHGPFLSLDRDDRIVALASRDDGARLREVLQALRIAGAKVSTVGDGRVQVRLPRIHRTLRPIVSVVPLQFLAYFAALRRGSNPDVMRSDIPRFSRALTPLFH